MNTQEINDKDWGRCISITNSEIELLVPLEIGPRIIHYSLRNQPNVFAEHPSQKNEKETDKWHSYGGHRLWHGPEDIVRTYIPDNRPIEVQQEDDVLILRQTTEEQTRLQKEMRIHISDQGTGVRVEHRIYNYSLFAIPFAAWAVSVMAPGGKAIISLPKRGSHDENLQAQTSLTLWAYTNLLDHRWQFGEKTLTFLQDPENQQCQKIGIARSGGWLAYQGKRQLFVTKYSAMPDLNYPDHGSTFEVYGDAKCVELESLSPLSNVAPRDYLELVENWELFSTADQNYTESDLIKILPEIE